MIIKLLYKVFPITKCLHFTALNSFESCGHELKGDIKNSVTVIYLHIYMHGCAHTDQQKLICLGKFCQLSVGRLREGSFFVSGRLCRLVLLWQNSGVGLFLFVDIIWWSFSLLWRVSTIGPSLRFGLLHPGLKHTNHTQVIHHMSQIP